ncbi:hypothetical protein ACPCAG_30815 [Streptomyces pseudogriseolus]|uniref:hypothetical protein n=1 Tax=Streptomyces pseudogriseolus TaxID=36817 RepID=UPI003FA304B6
MGVVVLDFGAAGDGVGGLLEGSEERIVGGGKNCLPHEVLYVLPGYFGSTLHLLLLSG